VNPPTSDQLAELRKGLQSRKKPEIRAGMHCTQPSIGSIQVHGAGEDYRLEWHWCLGQGADSRKQAAWRALCTAEELEMERLELGTLADLILQTQARVPIP